jgi:hypothetical protein
MAMAIQQLLKGYDPQVRELALAARELVLKIAPEAREKVYLGWQNVGYSMGGGRKDQFCEISPKKDRINFYFMRGTELADPAGLLEGNGKRMRHVKVRSLKQLQSGALQALIRSAVILSREA